MIAKIQAELNEMLQHYLFKQNDAQTKMNISHDIQVIIQRNLRIDPPAIKINSSKDGNGISICVENEDGLIGLDEYLKTINENTLDRRYPR